MPLFFYSQLPCCTLGSCSHLCVSGVFTYFYSELLNCGMWRSDSDLSPLFSRDLLCIKTTRVRFPPSPTLAVFMVAPSGAKPFFFPPISELTAVHWLQYCLCRRGHFPARHAPPGSAPRRLWPEQATGRGPKASAALDPARSGSLGRKESVGFWLCGPSTRRVLC